jgi:hypothetical protein
MAADEHWGGMYLAFVVLVMLILPVASVLMEATLGGSGASAIGLVGKWFVFWGVGVRLFLAGLRQMTRPEFTAETLLGIRDKEALILVRELGIANVAAGTVGVSTIVAPGWRMPSAVAGGIFFGLAGLSHLRRRERTRFENIALWSDLSLFAVLLVYCLGTMAR